jgi:hypothetical protein
VPIGDFVSLRILKGSFLPSLVLSFYDMMCSCLLPSIDWIGSYSLLRLIMRHLFFFCLVRSFFFTLTLLSLVVNVNHITYLFLFFFTLAITITFVLLTLPILFSSGNLVHLKHLGVHLFDRISEIFFRFIRVYSTFLLQNRSFFQEENKVNIINSISIGMLFRSFIFNKIN